MTISGQSRLHPPHENEAVGAKLERQQSPAVPFRAMSMQTTRRLDESLEDSLGDSLALDHRSFQVVGCERTPANRLTTTHEVPRPLSWRSARELAEGGSLPSASRVLRIARRREFLLP